MCYVGNEYMKNWLIIFILIASPNLWGQQKYTYKKKNSTQRGAIYLFGGYNRSVFTKSNIQFKGTGYDFTVQDATASDSPPAEIGDYFNDLAQFNFRVGFYYKEKFDLSIGIDHINYVMTSNQTAIVNGNIDATANSVLAGNYNSIATQLSPQGIEYAHNGGINYISAQIQHTNHFFRSKNRQHLFQYQFGIGLGALLTSTNYRWNDVSYQTDLAFGGLGGSGHVGLRADFFHRFFVQTKWSLGYMNLPNVQTIPLTDNRSKQQFVYADMQFGVGFFLYKRLKNACNSCPDWD